MQTRIMTADLSPQILLAMLLLALSEMSLAEDRKSVLVIESYHASYRWDAEYSRGLRDVLAESTDLKFFQMDTKRRPESEFQQRADLAWAEYLNSRPDLVILGDDNALKYLGPRFAATDTPVVYLGINSNPREYFQGLPENITGVLERPLIKRAILYMREIMSGSLGKVLILFDAGTTARTLLKEVFGDKTRLTVGPVEVHIRLINNYSEWREAIGTAPAQGYDAIAVGLYHTISDAEGEHVPAQRIITETSATSTVPLFAFWEFAVGQQLTAGGLVLDGYRQGAEAANLARSLLAGEPAPALPLSTGGGQLVFSRSQLLRWQISLPEAIAEEARFLP